MGEAVSNSSNPVDQHVSKYRLPPDRAAAVRTAPPINMTVLEAAAYLGISPRKIRELVASRDLRCARIGSRIIIRREWADQLLEN